MALSIQSINQPTNHWSYYRNELHQIRQSIKHNLIESILHKKTHPESGSMGVMHSFFEVSSRQLEGNGGEWLSMLRISPFVESVEISIGSFNEGMEENLEENKTMEKIGVLTNNMAMHEN